MWKIDILNINNEIIASEDSMEKTLQIDSISEKINDIASAKITVFYDSQICKREFLQKGNRINIYKNDKLAFNGIIKGFEAQIGKVVIILNDFLYLLQRRFLHEDKSYSDKSYKFILEDIFNHISIISHINLTLNCNIETLTNKNFKKRTSILNILKELAQDGYEFKNIGSTILFGKSVGEDKTAEVEYVYNEKEPFGQNIDNIKMIEDLKDFANGIIDKSGFYFDDDNVGEKGLFENQIYSDIDKTKYINENKQNIGDFTITTKTNDFFEVNIGDEVLVNIFSGNDILFYEGKMKVVAKNLIIGDLEKIQISLAKNKVKVKDFIDDFIEVKKRIEKLEK